MDKKNGQVRTTGLPLQQDREYLLTVIAADRLGSRSVPAVVSVVAGARPPQFTNASFIISIPENTPEGQPWVYTDTLFHFLFLFFERVKAQLPAAIFTRGMQDFLFPEITNTKLINTFTFSSCRFTVFIYSK